MPIRPSRGSLLLAAALLSTSCSGDATRPQPRVELEVAPSSLTLQVGERGQLVATVRNAANAAVRYTSSNPLVARVDARGEVTAESPGAAAITVVALQDTTVRTTVAVDVWAPPVSISLSPTSATLRSGETVRPVATVINGRGLGVRWTSSDEATASVAADGTVTAGVPGEATIRATALADTLQSATAQITVLPAAEPDPPAPRVTGVSPALLAPGGAAVLQGAEFSSDAAANLVHVAGVQVAVTEASPTQLVVQLPPRSAFECRPTGPAEVRVEVAGRTGSMQHPLAVAEPHTLAPGGSVSFLDGASARCHELHGTGGLYSITVVAANGAPNSLTPFQLAGRGGAGAGVAAARVEVPTAAPLSAELRARLEADAHHHHVLELSRELVERLGPPPRRVRPLARAEAPPQVGERLALRVPDINTVEVCRNYDEVEARVVYSGSRAVVLEDTAAPFAGTMDAELSEMGREFDDVMFGLLEQYFGNPLALNSQLRGHGRIYMLFTPVVNGTNALGFVMSGDFYPRSLCASSDETEIFYARVPTVEGGSYGSNTIAQWAWAMPATVIHEVKHITSFAERIARDRTVWEESWLEESTARVSEELWARTRFGYGQFGDVSYAQSVYCEVRPTWSECAGLPQVVYKHFAGMYPYLLNVEAFTPLGSHGGGGASFYGSGWSLVRWAIDHSGQPEAAFLRSLVQEPHLAGLGNLSAKLGRPIPRILADWTAAIGLAGYAAAPQRPELRMPSWSLSSIFSGLNQDFPTSFPRAWPLTVRRVGFGDFDVNVPGVRGGSAATFELSGGQSAPQLLHLRGPNGAAPASPSLGMTITRVQ